MPSFDSVGSIRGKASGDQYSNWLDEESARLEEDNPGHVLDSDAVLEEHKRCLQWLILEREKQAENRFEMSVDHSFYDNEQWTAEDAQEVKSRGQMPLVYNETAPMVDWLIGTERRTKVDWKVLPRAEDDVDAADIKTKVLKYVSDVNRVTFARSRAFADAIKGGVGWVDDGARDDPTQDVLYSKYEDWRNVLWDSMSYELDLSDARYLFRWRWVDEDIALMMFPERAAQIKQAVEDAGAFSTQNEEDTWYLGESANKQERSGTVYASGSGVAVDAARRRIKLIECQYRKPCNCKMVADGPMKGSFLGENDRPMQEIVSALGSEVVDRVMLRMHFMVFTEAHVLSHGPSTYRHNKFTLTPIWCYRRGRDRLPYGVIRRVRDIQQDLNKRASKALFMLNTNQIIADKGAVDDWNLARDEADRPDGLIVKNAGKEFTIRRDTDAATGQLQMMTLDAQSIQKTAGVNNENLGRSTNAVSGAAIEARQNQGAVGTTEPFDNHRYAVQVQGEKQVSLSEQFYTEEKVIRLTGAKGKVEWVKVNQPEIQPDGSVRWINDITASQADFIVSEADYAGTLRQVMFESLQQMAFKLPPEVSLRLLVIAMEFSDMPNHQEIADAIRQMTGERDPNKEMTPEEAQQAEQNMMMQAEAMQMQREQAMLALEEQRAKVAKLNAEAQSIMAGPQEEGGMPPEVAQAIQQIQSQAADQIDKLSQQLAKTQADLANRTLQISRDADVKLETARIDADSKVRVAEISAAADRQMAALEDRMKAIVDSLEQKLADKEAKDEADEKVKEAKSEPKEAKTEPAQLPPMNFTIQLPEPGGAGKKTITLKKGKDGELLGAEVEEE